MDNITKAKINLFAVLRNLQDLCSMDSVAADLIKDENISVQFNVPNVGTGTLKFANGRCAFERGKGPANLKLWFTSAEHFNKMIDGEKTVPLFVNVFKVGFLLNKFTKLADRMAYFLKPTDELLKDPGYFKINTYLTAYTAFFALCEIGNSDAVGKVVSSRMPTGDIQLSVIDGPQMVITITEERKLVAKLGTTDNMRALMQFGGLQIVNDILNGKKDIFSGLGSGEFLMKGFIPMLDNMSKLLSLVSRYLA